MAARLTSMLPRVVALTAILVLGSATISFAAENTLLAPAPAAETAIATPPLVTVPDVTGQAYVFAKGTLEERGFAWRVTGTVAGYPANTVVSQTPAAGTRVVDTGLPTVLVGLKRNGSYVQEGRPENASPYAGSKIRFYVRPKRKQKSAAKPKPAAAPAVKPKAAPKVKPKALPKPRPKALPKPKPNALPKPKPKVLPEPKVKPKPVAAPKTRAARPPAFLVAAAPKEPQHEIALPERARRLEAWVRAHPKPTNANVRHWLYQHEWIVTGARFGWSHGAEALEVLIRVDEQVKQRWELGAKSQAAARHALAAVRAKSR